MAALTSIPLVALDIGARSHAFAIDDGGAIKTGQLENRHGDVRAFFIRLLGSGRGLKVIMEATGIYFLDTALIADELGAEVFVINPKMAHHFARSLGYTPHPIRAQPGPTHCTLECPHTANRNPHP